MAKITIEFDDDLMANFLDQVAEQAGSSTTSSKGKPSKSKKEEPAEEESEATPEQVKELCNKLLELTDKAAVKAVISEFDCTTVAKACKLTGDDLADCVEALNEAIEEAGEGSEEEDGDEEITVDAVKAAVQAYSKNNGKEATSEILEDFDIKSVRSLNKLSQEDLEELYAEVCE